jgi:hypothetical protein
VAIGHFFLYVFGAMRQHAGSLINKSLFKKSESKQMEGINAFTKHTSDRFEPRPGLADPPRTQSDTAHGLSRTDKSDWPAF